VCCEPPSIEVPEIVRAKALAATGGGSWLRDLPDRVADRCDRWDLTVAEPLSGGTAAWVARVVRSGDSAAVVKLPVPDAANGRTTRRLLEADGRGFVRVLENAENDLLMEHLPTSLDRSGLAPDEQLRILSELLPRVWLPGAEPVDKAAGLRELLLAAPAEPVVDRALEFADRRSSQFRPDQAVTLHGDAAPSNVLLGADGRAAFIDPESFSGDPAYDVGVTLRDWSPQLLAVDDPAGLLRSWCRDAARCTGQDPQAVWEWAYLERVTTGVYARSLGAVDLAEPFLETARRLLPT